MKRVKLIITLSILLAGTALFAQKKLPRIKAKKIMADIKVGNNLEKDAWRISPEIKPDVYFVNELNKKVTFYTDVDSISVLIKEDTQFNFIISLKDSVDALTQIKYKPTNLSVLKKAAFFNAADKRIIPVFSYQNSSHPKLTALKSGFKLDSIAGGGNEITQILSLMHWIHNLVPHDGNHENPEVKNALSLISVCKKDNRGLNCRGLATVLNECYLAMGIKSRLLTCLPKDSNDTECHVINMVYSTQFNKWLWIDPTHDAYVMNEKGELLSVEEVRDRLIKNKPLILNPDANWNHKSSTVKENYLYNYMAKNLYRFECAVNSEYDYETPEAGKKLIYIELLPLDYYRQKPDKVESTSAKSGIIYIEYKTNNAKLFWQSPIVMEETMSPKTDIQKN